MDDLIDILFKIVVIFCDICCMLPPQDRSVWTQLFAFCEICISDDVVQPSIEASLETTFVLLEKWICREGVLSDDLKR